MSRAAEGGGVSWLVRYLLAVPAAQSQPRVSAVCALSCRQAVHHLALDHAAPQGTGPLQALAGQQARAAARPLANQPN